MFLSSLASQHIEEDKWRNFNLVHIAAEHKHTQRLFGFWFITLLQLPAGCPENRDMPNINPEEHGATTKSWSSSQS